MSLSNIKPALEVAVQVRNNRENDWGYVEVTHDPDSPGECLRIRRHDATGGDPKPIDITITIAEAPLLAQALMLVVSNQNKGTK